MKDVPLIAGLIAGGATGLYVGLCLGYIVGRWDTRFRRWCEAWQARTKAGGHQP